MTKSKQVKVLAAVLVATLLGLGAVAASANDSEPPSAVLEALSANSVSFTLEAPADQPNISQYFVYVGTGDGPAREILFPGDRNTISIDDLEPATNYEVIIYAYGENGSSEPIGIEVLTPSNVARAPAPPIAEAPVIEGEIGDDVALPVEVPELEEPGIQEIEVLPPPAPEGILGQPGEVQIFDATATSFSFSWDPALELEGVTAYEWIVSGAPMDDPITGRVPVDGPLRGSIAGLTPGDYGVTIIAVGTRESSMPSTESITLR